MKKFFLLVPILSCLLLSGCGGSSGPKPPTGPTLSVDSNTVALWHFDENTGTTSFDSSSNHRDLHFAASPKDPAWIDSGRSGFGSCLVLDTDPDGTDNASITMLPADSAFSGNQFTIEGWINISTLKKATILDCETFWLEIDEFGRLILAIQDVEGGICRMTTAYGTDAGPDTVKINTGIWYYVAATYSPAEKTKIYINGVLQQRTGDTTFPEITAPNEYSFAKTFYFTHQCITGMIDEVRISNIARTATEISSYYTQATK